MLLSGLYMAFRLKLMFSLFAGNPKQNSEPKYHLMKDRINEFVRQIRYNILQMKNIFVSINAIRKGLHHGHQLII